MGCGHLGGHLQFCFAATGWQGAHSVWYGRLREQGDMLLQQGEP